MVSIVSPPGIGIPNPKLHILNKDTKLYRIFRSQNNTTALTFRAWGPLHRFDHHLGNCPRFSIPQDTDCSIVPSLPLPLDVKIQSPYRREDSSTCQMLAPPTQSVHSNVVQCRNFCYEPLKREPQKDLERGINYMASTLSSCLVEVFGDIGCIEITDHHLAIITLKTDLKLLDIRGTGAMRAGANEASLAKTEQRAFSQAWSRYFYEQKEVYHEIHGIIYGNAHNDEDAIALYERVQNHLTCLKGHVQPLKHQLLRIPILQAAEDNNLTVIPY